MIGFKGLSGEHSGGNLGRYFIGLCERVGIITQTGSKVCCTAICNLFVYLSLFFVISATDH